MKFVSTRNGKKEYEPCEAIIKGIADDGGLFVPQVFPLITFDDIAKFAEMSYEECAAKVLSLYLDDIGYDKLLDITKKAYSKFDGDACQALIIADHLAVMELWHGPTFAFKDMALTVLPYLIVESKKILKKNEKTLILVATSGDTGKAALEGFKDVAGTEITVLFPNDGVSEMQKLQMLTQEGNNVHVFSINGNFDDAQSTVKAIFNDKKIVDKLKEKNIVMSSANSINFGRLAPQIAYYIYTYASLVSAGQIKNGEKINFIVPTGNFGNILAGYYAFKMGLPINNLIIASNKNNILTDFFETGEYDINRKFFKTISPSMDILISSNLERLLFELMGRNSDYIIDIYKSLSEKGKFTVDKEVLKNSIFKADWADEEDTRETINESFKNEDYLFDTHTAVAKSVYDSHVKDFENIYTVIVSTASPFKFAIDVYNAIAGKKEKDAVESLSKLEDFTAWECPEAILSLKDKKIIHNKTINKEDARKAILADMGIDE